MHDRTALLAVCLLAMALVAPAQGQPGPSQSELDAAASNVADWLHVNHDYGGQRFVDATGINRDNVRSLRPACVYRLGDRNPFHAGPVVYRGVMYVTTAYATIALDAVSCRVRWRHDWPMKVREIAPHNGGVAVKDGKIVRGTRDGYLLALDAETGRLLWERAAADVTKREAFTVPPVIFDNLIIIGPVGNEVAIKGWIGAFSLETGEPVWRFNTVPGPGEPSAETWGPMGTATPRGGSVWTPLSVDPTRGLVFVPVGNAVPPLNADARPGANLYTNSLVVLDARTGKLMWHYQPRSSDTHDWDLTQVSPLFSAVVKGERRRLVSVAGKDGLLHVLDTDSREHLYEVVATRRANTETPLTEEGVHVCPGMFGGVQRNGPAFSPRTNMLYVASVEWCGTYTKSRASAPVAGRPYMGGTWQPDPPKEARGWLTAIDASTGSVRWRYESRRPILAGVTITSADLVFTGDLDGDFLVLDARDGTVLYRHNTGGRMSGGVVTYQIGGKQYVAVTSGAATIFWRTAPAPATVTIFSIPESGSPPK